MLKFISYIGLGIISFLVVLGFVNATTYTQLAISIFFYPIIVYLAFKIFSRNTISYKPAHATVQPQKFDIPRIQPSIDKPRSIASAIDRTLTADVEKRAFLKLIGGVGLTYFAFSLFNKKVGGLFGGTNPQSTGSTLVPSQNDLSAYKIAEIDDSIVAYYGYLNNNNGWYIMREDTTAGSFRYVRGDSGFPEAWAKRDTPEYDYYGNVFN